MNRNAVRVPRRWWPRPPRFLNPSRSAVPGRLLRSIQSAALSYSYRGVPCFKNPFDLALYSLMIDRERPATLVEIGSAAGGSALWFADQCRARGLDTVVISVDIQPPLDVYDPTVTFIKGDVRSLESSRLPELLADCPRPLMVIEDGPHTFDACLGALRFFHEYLHAGEYLIIEDGIVGDLGYRSLRRGPTRAIRAFMRTHPGSFEINRGLCDYFGRNVTWNTDGYLRRLASFPEVTAQ